MTRLIKLQELPTFWLTCEKTVKAREQPIIESLNSVGIASYKKIMCPITNPYHHGLAKGHLQALTRRDPPFLVLEDDARIVPGNQQDLFVVPDDLDALYLGSTTFGRIRRQTMGNATIAADAGGPYLRVYNMLGMHAIVYLSPDYVGHVVATLLDYLSNGPGANDDPIADGMHRRKIWCLKKPLFFQDDGKANVCTTQPLEPFFP